MYRSVKMCQEAGVCLPTTLLTNQHVATPKTAEVFFDLRGSALALEARTFRAFPFAF